MTEDLLIQTLANVPFAVVLVAYLVLDFKHRAVTMAAMQNMVSSFTSALKECCDEDVSR